MDFEGIKKRILNERKRGDTIIAAERAGVTRTCLDYAIRREKFEDMTAAEERIVVEMIKLLDERIERRKEIGFLTV
jgi:hypothetical protein